MKKLLLSLLLGFQLPAAITIVTHGLSQACSSAASPCAGGGGRVITAGNSVVVVVAMSTADNSDQTVSVVGADSRSSPTFTDTYVQYQKIFLNSGANSRILVLFKLASVHGSASYVWTVSWTGGVNGVVDQYFVEINGASLGTDGIPSASGTGSTVAGSSVTTSNVTTTNANDIWVAAFAGNGFLCGPTWAAAFTQQDADIGFSNLWSAVATHIGSSTETLAASASGCTVTWSIATWPLKDTGGDGGGYPRRDLSIGIGH